MMDSILHLCKNLLFPESKMAIGLKTYAIVDSIRFPNIKERILFESHSFADLWHELLMENSHKVPLYLVELQKESSLTDSIVQAHSNSAVTYLLSAEPIDVLQKYYSSFTCVKIEERPKEYSWALFGFYDPNILPDYMKTLYSKEKIDTFFAVAPVWIAPLKKSQETLFVAYRNKKGDLVSGRVDMSQYSDSKDISLDFEEMDLCSFDTQKREIVIDYRQMEIFEKIEAVKFVKSLLLEYRQKGFDFRYEEQDHKEIALFAFREAKESGIKREDGFYRYILLSLLSGKPLKGCDFFKRLESLDESGKIDVLQKELDRVKRSNEYGYRL